MRRSILLRGLRDAALGSLAHRNNGLRATKDRHAHKIRGRAVSRAHESEPKTQTAVRRSLAPPISKKQRPSTSCEGSAVFSRSEALLCRFPGRLRFWLRSVLRRSFPRVSLRVSRASMAVAFFCSAAVLVGCLAPALVWFLRRFRGGAFSGGSGVAGPSVYAVSDRAVALSSVASALRSRSCFRDSSASVARPARHEEQDVCSYTRVFQSVARQAER